MSFHKHPKIAIYFSDIPALKNKLYIFDKCLLFKYLYTIFNYSHGIFMNIFKEVILPYKNDDTFFQIFREGHLQRKTIIHMLSCIYHEYSWEDCILSTEPTILTLTNIELNYSSTISFYKNDTIINQIRDISKQNYYRLSSNLLKTLVNLESTKSLFRILDYIEESEDTIKGAIYRERKSSKK